MRYIMWKCAKDNNPTLRATKIGIQLNELKMKGNETAVVENYNLHPFVTQNPSDWVTRGAPGSDDSKLQEAVEAAIGHDAPLEIRIGVTYSICKN